MDLVTAKEAAERLGVSVRQAQRLTRAGKLHVVGVDRIDYASVLQLQALRQGTHHRAWSEATAWAAVAVLSNVTVDWMGEVQRSRLKSELRAMSGVELAARTRNRAVIHRLRGHTAAARRIAMELIRSGSSDEMGGLAAAANRVDGYANGAQFNRLCRTYHLEHDWEGNITLRVTTFDLDTIQNVASKSNILAALDLAGSLDARERATGLTALDRALEGFRG